LDPWPSFVEDFYRQRVPGLGALDVERSCQGIVALRHAQRVAGLADGIAEAVYGIGFEDVARLQPGYRSVGRGISVFEFAWLDVVADYARRSGLGLSQQSCPQRQQGDE